MNSYRHILCLATTVWIGLAGGGRMSANPPSDDPETLPTRILFVLDASVSMHSRWETSSRMNVAKESLLSAMDQLQGKPGLKFGLRVYGHTSPKSVQDCKDTRLEVPLGTGNINEIKSRMDRLTPRGVTPIAYSLERAASDFPHTPGRNIIILLTDGLESCDGDPCEVSLALQRKGVILRPFVVGMELSDNVGKQMNCIGSYHNTRTEKDFRQVIQSVVERALGGASAQINLLDSERKPSERDVNVTIYDNFSGQADFNYYQTLNQRGRPDTISLDPVKTYDLTVHTYPPVHKKNVEVHPNRHTVIPAKTPQGKLMLNLTGITIRDNLHGKIKAIVRKPGSSKIVNVQGVKDKVRYLTGKYDVEILTLPPIYMEQVEVAQDKTTTIDVPGPGLLNLQVKYDGYGGIFTHRGNRLRKVYQFPVGSKNYLLAMQPGKYTIIYRPKYKNRAVRTIEKTFTIEANSSITIKLE